MKKGSNVQRSLFSPWLRPLSSARSGSSLWFTRFGSSLLAACCFLAACSGGTIQDGTRDNPDSGGSDNPSAGGSSNNQPTGGGPQGGRTNGNQGGQSSGSTGNTGNNGNAGSGNGTSVGGNSSNGGMTSTGDAPPSALPAANACGSDKTFAGPRMLRRLTSAEFNASIFDLFQDKTAPITPVFNDQKILGFSVDASALTVQGLNADQLMSNAETIATWAVANHMSVISSCTTKDDNCGKQMIKNFGKKAFRMPLTDAQVNDYNTRLFSPESTFTDGATAVVTAMLQSPYFLYRSELGTGGPGSSGALTPYEAASSLSYLLTGSTPDATLLSAADSLGSNPTAKQVSDMIANQAQRLISTPAAQDAVMNFMSGWLGLDRVQNSVKDASLNLTDAQRDDMSAETRAFLLDAFNSSGKVSDLFTSQKLFLNKNLASYYGLDPGSLSTNVQLASSLMGKREGGLLAQGAILTGYARSDISSPTQRGHLVRTRLLCQDVPPPPAGLDTKFQPSSDPNLTTRDHYLKEHATPDRAQCYGCHQLMDQIGFAFEHYDSIGKYRATEKGLTIDATGTIAKAPEGGDVQIDGLTGAKGLQTYLSTSDQLKSCMIRWWSYYSFGTSSWAQDGCTYDAIKTDAAANSYSLKSVLMAIIHSPRFTQRSGDL